MAEGVFEKIEKEREEFNHLEAQKFYEADSTLNPSQRDRLRKCFGKQMIAYPLVTVPVILGMIQIPRYFLKGKPAAKNQLRFFQVVFGVSGVFLGQETSQLLGYSWNYSSLSNDPPAQTCYTILGMVPPQLGYRYYQNTAKHPELAMKDPKTIDWNNSLGFPMNLIFTKKPGPGGPGLIGPGGPGSSPGQTRTAHGQEDDHQHLYKRPDRKAEEWKRGYEAQAKDTQDDRPGGATSSWDKIRSQWGRDTSSSQSSTWSPTSKQQEFDQMIDNAKPGGYTNDLSEEQRKFDELIERNRQGAGADDFASSEKKWS